MDESESSPKQASRYIVRVAMHVNLDVMQAVAAHDCDTKKLSFVLVNSLTKSP